MKKIDFNKIYNKNCLEGMKLIEKNKIDLIITDPPFARILKRLGDGDYQAFLLRANITPFFCL